MKKLSSERKMPFVKTMTKAKQLNAFDSHSRRFAGAPADKDFRREIMKTLLLPLV